MLAPIDSEPNRRDSLGGPEAAEDQAAFGPGSQGVDRAVVGTVIGADGRPLEGALVLLAPSPIVAHVRCDTIAYVGGRAEQRTDEDGGFRIAPVQPGRVLVTFRAPGHAPLSLVLNVSGEATDLDIGAQQLSRGTTLTGRVVDESNAGVGGVRITQLLSQANVMRALPRDPAYRIDRGVTDSSGGFVIDQLAPGARTLRFEGPNHPAVVSDDTPQEAGQHEGLVVRLNTGLSLAGHVVDEGRASFAGLSVVAVPADQPAPAGLPREARWMSAKCAEDGRFEFTALPRESRGLEYLVRPRRVNSATKNAQWLGQGERVEVGSVDARVSLESTARLRFELRDGLSGQPLDGARLKLQRWHGENMIAIDRVEPSRLVSTAPGAYELADIAPPSEGEEIGVHIDVPSYRSVIRRLPQQEFELDVDLGLIELEPLATVMVNVVSAATGAPVPGARVERRTMRPPGAHEGFGQVDFTAPNAPVATFQVDAEGMAQVTLVPDTPCALQALHAEYAPSPPTAIESTGAALPKLTLELDRGATLSIDVVDVDGFGLAGVTVLHRMERLDNSWSAPLQRVTDDDGVVAFELLVAGKHGFRLRDRPIVEASEWFDVELTSGDDEMVRLTTVELERLLGRVTLGAQPIQGAKLSLVPEAQVDLLDQRDGMRPSLRMTQTDSEGLYAFESLLPGRYVLRIEHGELVTYHQESIWLDPGGTRLDIALRVGVVRGRVTNGEDEPLGGVRVTAAPAQDPTPVQLALIGSDTPRSADIASIRSATTAADGSYELVGVLLGVRLVVTAVADGHIAATSAELTLDDRLSIDGIDLQLGAAGSLVVQVDAGGGTPLTPGGIVRIRARLANGASVGPERWRRMNAEGAARFDHLEPGQWVVQPFDLFGNALSAPSRTVVIEASAVRRVKVSL